jgi:protein SCO1/2
VHFFRLKWRSQVLPAIFLATGALALAPSTAMAGSLENAPRQVAPSDASKIPTALAHVGITDKRGTKVDLDHLSFRNEAGQLVTLGSFFHQGKPVLLTMAYYECPNLCGLMFNGMVSSLKILDWVPGNQFQIVNVSINPKEGPELASKKKASLIRALGKPEAAAGWHFLTGDQPMIEKLASQIGYGFKYDPEGKQYAHASGVFVMTPEGKISQILYGIEFLPKDLKFAMIEASRGQVGSVVERLVMFCYRYNPGSHSYSLYVFRIMEVAAGVTLLIVALWLGLFWLRQRRIMLSKEQPSGG